MEFDEKQKSEIETLAALNYTVKQIAIYLDVPAAKIGNSFATMRYDKKEKDARAKEAKHRIFGSS